MSTISFRVTDEERRAMENYSKICNKSMSEMLKEIFFEKLENEFDLEVIKKYELKNSNKFITHEDMKEKYGL